MITKHVFQPPRETLKPHFSIRGRSRHILKDYTTDSAILALRGIQFSDYRIRLNPNKQKRQKAVGVIPCLSLPFLYIGNDPKNDCRFRVFQGTHLKYITQTPMFQFLP